MTATDVAAQPNVSAADRAALRSAVADLLAQRCTEADVRRAMATPEGYDAALWAQLSQQVGATGLVVPVEHGGAGATFAEAAVVAEELGRALCPSPYLASTLAALALVAGADDTARARLLPALAAGERVAAVALEQPAAGAQPAPQVSVSRDGELTGVVPFVLWGGAADVFVVVATAADGPAVYLTERGPHGVDVTPLPAMDETQRIARVTFEGAQGTRLGGADLVGYLLDAGAVAVACDQVGGAEAAMTAAIGYAKVRTQFGRPIGSFQAIKHKCADMFLAIESAKAAARRAAQEVAARGPEATLLASIAKAWCSDAYVAAAADNVQIHGGVGFTWEHSAHLFLKRAKTDEQLFGDARHHRARLADVLGI